MDESGELNVNPLKGAAEFPKTMECSTSPNAHSRSPSMMIDGEGSTTSSSLVGSSIMNTGNHLGNLPSIKGLKVCCIGAGYVGGPTMAMIAKSM